ncbi:FliM/FliN family flagellar motor switch protein [Paracoccus jiaweipingae]|uniref:FliM/FliN family flagellar motor switch protein n=1 Tax=unclassified Paracoccus (in: a-proteobacteria) TaxID=2688777 RepID=UPI0037B3A5FB
MNDINHMIATDHIQVELAIRLGTVTLTIGEISALGANEILPLAQEIGDGVELCVGDRVIARGEIIRNDSDGKLAIRVIGQAEAT